MRLPEIANRLRELAREHDLPELAELADEMKRRKPGSRAAPKSVPMTPLLAQRIRAYKNAHPDMSHVEIGTHFNVNPGRVSEAVKGFRE